MYDRLYINGQSYTLTAISRRTKRCESLLYDQDIISYSKPTPSW